jgi:sugar/nucleoside kinase (ribokinase family)
VVSLAVVGNVNVDLLVWPASDVPPPGVERPVDRIDLRVGGAAAVTGATLARLGASPVVAGCVGRDALGHIALGELREYGLDTRHVLELEEAPTGASLAFEAPGRDRSFLIALGSLSVFEPSMVPEEALDAGLFLVCGYFNLPAMRGRATADLLREARSRGATTLLDTGWDHDDWPGATLEEIRALLPLVDVFVPNEAEAHRLSGEADPEAAALALAEISGGWAVVKLGAEGCLAAAADGSTRRAVAPAVKVIDTTGAGDAFNAGLMLALSRGAEPAEAIETAVRVASCVVSRPSHDRYPRAADLPA